MTCTGCTRAMEAAVKTLENKGYTYHGGEIWKPPLGKPPNFKLIYRIDCWIEHFDIQGYGKMSHELQSLLKEARVEITSRGLKCI